MVVDTSVLVALYLCEPGWRQLAVLIDEAPAASMSVASRIECVSVLCGRRFRAEPERVSDFINGLNLDHHPVTAEQMWLAISAVLRFGRGRHPAGLNIGDCFSYGLAKSLDAPLLFKGDDFAQTDIMPAWRP